MRCPSGEIFGYSVGNPMGGSCDSLPVSRSFRLMPGNRRPVEMNASLVPLVSTEGQYSAALLSVSISGCAAARAVLVSIARLQRCVRWERLVKTMRPSSEEEAEKAAPAPLLKRSGRLICQDPPATG